METPGVVAVCTVASRIRRSCAAATPLAASRAANTASRAFIAHPHR